LEDDILRYKESPNEYAKEKENLISAQEIERKQEIKIFGLEKDIQNVKQQIVLLDKEIEDKKLIKEKIRNLGLYADWIMEYFVPLINTMEKQVMLQVHSSFNTLFTSWFAVLMDDDSISARLDEEFSPIIEQNGYETILTDLSGGEKTAVALAYRLALNKVINDFVSSINTKDLIILDEPTDGFSAQQLDKVREVLDQLNMRQVILVSHENKIESFVENVLRIEKTGHVSRVIS
ncbi:DNA repair protein Rad50, partial [Candidatus Woesearchaeota archaeon CG10_big_fil_rev_8_21_14_0_10_34_8]